jgi:TolB-like protein/DNA-binding winged helix-turn-helix (wHTH) protein/Tfp pilus assembly protein PilF
MDTWSTCKATMPGFDLRFGPYELKSRVRQLHKHGVKLKLRPQSFRVLEILLERPGDLITREEFRRELWPSDTFVDFEHGLNTSVKDLRSALNDSASEPRYIETLPKLGYRFIATVEPAESPSTELPPAASVIDSSQAPVATPESLPVQQQASRRSALGWPVLLVAALVIGASVAAYFHWKHSQARRQTASEHLMVAVLPFENLTGDSTQEYFSDGMTEEMIAQLGRVDPEHLGVIARTSVMHYKHSGEQLDQIGRALGVEYVLEGSVRRDSNKVRISAQLIQTKDQSRIWARQYDRELNGLLVLQGEIAHEAADEILLALGERKLTSNAAFTTSQVTKSYEAYDLYLKGRYFLAKRTPQGFQQAAESFEQAVAKDPNYAPAYAGLADSYTLMGEYDMVPPGEIIPKARAAALKALDLDEKLAEAHVSLAVIAQNYDWDWQTADKEFRRAIVLDPNYATGHHWYAEHLAFLGRFDEAFPEIQRARQLDPLSLIIQTDNAVFLYYSRQYDPAIAQFRAILEMEPNFPRVHILESAYVQKGQFAEALADVENWRRFDPDAFWGRTMEAYINARAGRPAQARRILDKLQSRESGPIDPLALVAPYIALGDKDRAFMWLDRAVAVHSPGLTALGVDPTYDPLRSEPRFQALLVRVGLAKP